MRFRPTLLLLSICTFLHAANGVSQPDTLFSVPENNFQRIMSKISSSKAYQMTYVGVPLIVGGLIVKSEDDHFRGLRNSRLPSFNKHYDDYLQYVPAITMLSMKAGGVEGRSSWGRMLVSDAFSAVIMASITGSLKIQTKVTRPDGSNNHSFPSGHTATAFMTATMMHKEYGERSPWYSIGAYSVATTTGLTRMANNKHWLSDVLAGAGFGIVSTELGYFLADLIFKNKGIHHFSTSDDFEWKTNPSFFGIYLGLNIAPGIYTLPDYGQLDFSSGSTAGLEGAWFFNPYIGVGGRFSATNMAVVLNNEAQDESTDLMAGHVGFYFSYPITPRLLAGSKILGGYSHYSSCHLPGITIGSRGGISMGTGTSLTFLAKQNLGVRFFLDYNLMPTPMKCDKSCTQIMVLGSAVSVAF
ncbi:phosphatase PAP2 family protein [Bacteroides sp.]